MVNKVEKKQQGLTEAVNLLTRKLVVKISTGQEVEIRVCKVRDISVFLEFVAEIWSDLELPALDKANQGAIEQSVREKLFDAPFILKLISTKSEMVYSVLSRFTSLRVDELEELDIDDALLVVTKVIEVNRDFFTKTVQPMFASAAASALKTERTATP